MTGEIKGYLLDYGGTLDTAGCHWGKFIWHGYERCHVGVAWDDFREAYVHTERALGQGGIILPTMTFRETLATKIGNALLGNNDIHIMLRTIHVATHRNDG